MELSLYLAKAWGLFSVIVAISLLFNKKDFINMLKHLSDDNLGVLIAGIIALGLGCAQVVGYNSWTFDYRGLVTLLGWASLIKGAAILFVPGYIERFAKLFAKESWYTVSFVVFFILGAYLFYMGFTG